MGTALARAGADAGLALELTGRDGLAAAARFEVALLCVPDAEIGAASEAVRSANPGIRLVGHTSGATGLGALSAPASFSLHPLQTIPAGTTSLAGAPAAVSGSDDPALELARDLAEALGMRPFEVPEEARAAYHAAASIASNFLIALEESAVELLDAAGIESGRELLTPLVLQSAANWAERGGEALTGPIARGDEATVAAHRRAIRELAPELEPMYEQLAERTRALSRSRASRIGDPLVITVSTKAELRDALTDATTRRPDDRPCPDDGRAAPRSPLAARSRPRDCDVVVMSLFVNPAQFAPGEDLERYPRDLGRDTELAAEAGVDLLYAPSVDEVYPAGFTTKVEVEGLTDVLCGAPSSRGRSHFRGVTTVVAKLLNTVGPDVAYFGQKDAQQAAVIRRMALDLDFPVRIEVEPTVREPDGLAMSSRNAYLDPGERERAAAINRALAAARAAAQPGGPTSTSVEAAGRILAEAGIEPEYLDARGADDLAPIESFNGRTRPDRGCRASGRGTPDRQRVDRSGREDRPGDHGD